MRWSRLECSAPPIALCRRLSLAKWIANPDNPLTARVMVNRIWQYHFGRGLAGNPNNFGKMGKKPTHPDLINWLAATFIERGWSVKAMHRVIMLSEAYQRASAPVSGDPEWLASIPPRRLEAEEFRDAMLAISGELSPDTGGPGTLSPVWQPSLTRRERNRRTVYTYQKRGVGDPMLEVFNSASMNES